MKKAFVAILSLFVIFFIFALMLPLFQNKSEVTTSDTSFSCETNDLSGLFTEPFDIAKFEGHDVKVPQLVFSDNVSPVLGSNNDDKWIEVDLSNQKLIAWEGGNIFLESSVSTGLPRTPTPTGEFRIWIKLRATRMRGGEGKYYYNLPNVPFVMYFSNAAVPGSKGYGLHGAYWHNDFGTRRSHGCVNLPIPIAEKLYYWATPDIPGGKSMIKSTNENPGTRIVIHE